MGDDPQPTSPARTTAKVVAPANSAKAAVPAQSTRRPSADFVVGIHAYQFLHRFFGGPSGWLDKTPALTPQEAALLSQLLASGAMYLDVEYAPERFGFATRAFLWITAVPSALRDVGEALARHPEVSYVGAIAVGPCDLGAVVATHDSHELFLYLADRFSVLPGVAQVETSPVLRRAKQLTHEPAQERAERNKAFREAIHLVTYSVWRDSYLRSRGRSTADLACGTARGHFRLL